MFSNPFPLHFCTPPASTQAHQHYSLASALQFPHAFLCVIMHKAHAHCDCCEEMHACTCLCLVIQEAHAHYDCCEAMHLCACLCVLVHKAHAHCDCCEAVHACVGVCTRRMLTVIAARLCIHVCVFGLEQGAWLLYCCVAMHACVCVFGLVQVAWSWYCCVVRHACV